MRMQGRPHVCRDGGFQDSVSSNSLHVGSTCARVHRLFEALLTPDDAVISDELNHASIIDGIRLCKARKERYAHKNMEALEEKLQAHKDARMRLIVTDGVFR